MLWGGSRSGSGPARPWEESGAWRTLKDTPGREAMELSGPPGRGGYSGPRKRPGGTPNRRIAASRTEADSSLKVIMKQLYRLDGL